MLCPPFWVHELYNRASRLLKRCTKCVCASSRYYLVSQLNILYCDSELEGKERNHAVGKICFLTIKLCLKTVFHNSSMQKRTHECSTLCYISIVYFIYILAVLAGVGSVESSAPFFPWRTLPGPNSTENLEGVEPKHSSTPTTLTSRALYNSYNIGRPDNQF